MLRTALFCYPAHVDSIILTCVCLHNYLMTRTQSTDRNTDLFSCDNASQQFFDDEIDNIVSNQNIQFPEGCSDHQKNQEAQKI